MQLRSIKENAVVGIGGGFAGVEYNTIVALRTRIKDLTKVFSHIVIQVWHSYNSVEVGLNDGGEATSIRIDAFRRFLFSNN